MRRTKSTPSLRRKRSKSRKKLNRTRSAPKRISTSRKKRSKKKSKKRSKPRMLQSIVPLSVPQLDWRAAHPDQHARLLKAQEYRSIVPRPVPQLDWRAAHPDQYSRIYGRSIPAQNVQVVKKKGGSKKSQKTKSESKRMGSTIDYDEIYDKIEPILVKNRALLKERDDILRDMGAEVPENVREGLYGLIYDQKKLLSRETRAHNELKEGKTLNWL